MNLPESFINKLKNQLGNEFETFLQSYSNPRFAGLRANSLKISPEDLKVLLPFLKERINWSKDGFYYEESTVRPAKNSYYAAGLYYIQEPSAMYPAELLKANPGERVLDLCAAPGGKSLQLAAQLGGQGILVSNDLNSQRAKVLLKNIERYGVVNAIVLNESPDRLAETFPEFFNKILVDAPCSGEGMFRKEPEMMKDWNEEEVLKYAGWQADILASVPKLLRPGGEVVYSTCTFSKEENEEQITKFLTENPDFEIVEMHRLWPHKIKGEGHFIAKLRNKASLEGSSNSIAKSSLSHTSSSCDLSHTNSCCDLNNLKLSDSTAKALAEFSLQVWRDEAKWQEWLPKGGQIIERSGHILWESLDLPPLRGLKVLRSGWLLGIIEKGRFRPSQAFALGLPPEAVFSVQQGFALSPVNSEEALMATKYLRGETLQLEGKKWGKGWHLISLGQYPLGWAKSAGNWLKNEYPPGWRWVD